MPGSVGSGMDGSSSGSVGAEDEEGEEEAGGDDDVCAFHQYPSPLEIIVAVTVTVGAAASHSVPACSRPGVGYDWTTLRRCRRSLFMLRMSSRSKAYVRYRKNLRNEEDPNEMGKRGCSEGVRCT